MAKYGTIQALNAQWQTNYSSWANFLDKRNASPNLAGADADLRAFDVLYANQYFSTTQQGMREAAPNHLYLGARFTGGVRVAPAQAAVQYADVISINRYGPDVSVLPAGLEGDVPLISGEYHYSANDTGLLSDGLKTAADQADRADKFATYLTSAMSASIGCNTGTSRPPANSTAITTTATSASSASPIHLTPRWSTPRERSARVSTKHGSATSDLSSTARCISAARKRRTRSCCRPARLRS
jgi:hypothetical protein